jgi:carbon storage regulator
VLVLSRNPGQSVVIGHDIIVTVLEVRGDVVRIGIAAPREIDVHREEVYKELQDSNRAAALPPAADGSLPTPPRRPPAPRNPR